jgi:hypothetical protein
MFHVDPDELNDFRRIACPGDFYFSGILEGSIRSRPAIVGKPAPGSPCLACLSPFPG